MTRPPLAWLVHGLVLSWSANLSVALAEEYPTKVVAEYVYVCMKANGENAETLDKCSCAIDVIASVLPYERYETAETFKRMAQLAGDNGAAFRNNVQAKASIDEWKRAEVESEVRCF
jgi:hypothetical protein